MNRPSRFITTFACVLAVFKIFDLIRHRPIHKKHGHGTYHFGDTSTEFGYKITFENRGGRPIFISDMHVNLLDNKKKTLSIFARVEHIQRKLDNPDIFERGFSYRVNKKLPQKTYFIHCKIFTSGRTHTLKIRINFIEDIMDDHYEQIQEGRRRGLIE